MFVNQKMKTNVITTTKQMSLADASHLMTRYGVRHLPVMGEDICGVNHLVGIMTYSDILRSLPSPAAAFEMRESKYFFSLLTVGEVMPKNQEIITIHPDDGVEEAALMMRSYQISSLPVVNSQGDLIGIITDSDILDAFVTLLGVRTDGCRITVDFIDHPGVVADITDAINQLKINITRMVLLMGEKRDEKCQMIIRIQSNDPTALVAEIRRRGYEVMATDLKMMRERLSK